MAPKVSAETADRLQRAAVAKNELVSQYLHLGANLKRCSAAVEAYAHALNEASDTKEIIDLLKAPLSAPMPTGFPEYLPFLYAKDQEALPVGNGSGDVNSKKRSKSAEAGEESEVELDANGKKKRKKAAKKAKDPDAPKRPPSAYIIFQNEIRERVKSSNPGVPYSEILQQISEQWKALGEDKQRAFKEKADAAMATWRETAAEYTKHKDEAALNNDSMAVDPAEAAAIQAALTAKPKKDKKPSAKKEAKAAAAPALAAPPASVPQTKKESKKDAKAKIAAPSAPTTTSTPTVKNVALPKPASPVKAPASLPVKKNVPQTTQDSSDSDSETSSDDSSDEDDD